MKKILFLMMIFYCLFYSFSVFALTVDDCKARPPVANSMLDASSSYNGCLYEPRIPITGVPDKDDRYFHAYKPVGKDDKTFNSDGKGVIPDDNFGKASLSGVSYSHGSLDDGLKSEDDKKVPSSASVGSSVLGGARDLFVGNECSQPSSRSPCYIYQRMEFKGADIVISREYCPQGADFSVNPGGIMQGLCYFPAPYTEDYLEKHPELRNSPPLPKGLPDASYDEDDWDLLYGNKKDFSGSSDSSVSGKLGALYAPSGTSVQDNNDNSVLSELKSLHVDLNNGFSLLTNKKSDDNFKLDNDFSVSSLSDSTASSFNKVYSDAINSSDSSLNSFLSGLDKFTPNIRNFVLPVQFFGNSSGKCIPLEMNIKFSPYLGDGIIIPVSTAKFCDIYDDYLRNLLRFLIYVFTAYAIIMILDKALRG